MKINVKALLLWGIIFPFIISTFPMWKPSTNNYAGSKLTNRLLSVDEIEQILEILDVSINGRFGEFIHNSAINSITAIDQDLRNHQFSIIYYSNNAVDTGHLFTSILADEEENLAKLHLRIYGILTEYLKDQLPYDFKINVKVVIANNRSSEDKIRAYEIESEAPIEQIKTLESYLLSDNAENNMKNYLQQLKQSGNIKLAALPNEI